MIPNLSDFNGFAYHYKFPSKEGAINDIELTAQIVWHLHQAPHGTRIDEEVIIDKLLQNYNASESKIREVLYTLVHHQILTIGTTIKMDAPANNINSFEFTVKKKQTTNSQTHSSLLIL